MATRSLAGYQALFVCEGVPAGIARPTRIRATEEMSASYVVSVDLVVEAGDMKAEGLLRRPAEVAIVRAGDGVVVRRLSGLVTRVTERAKSSASPTGQRLNVTIESPLAVLRLTTDYRIFQDQTTKDIVSAVLKSCGVPESSVSWRLGSSYPKREVCTQFDESSFQFVSRILEEDGIFYFFEFGADGAKVVFTDGDSGYAKTEPTDAIVFRERTGLLSEEGILELLEVEQVRSTKVTLRDHDFKRPSLNLDASAEQKSPFHREHYHYPGRYVDPSEGKRRARLRLDALVAEATGVVGESNVFGLTPGHTFTLSDAPRPALDKEWVVVRIEHAWDDARDGEITYSNRFHLLPKTLQFRPRTRTPRPFVPGPQLAVVTGPKGEEIHCDEFGRVRVQYMWDRYGKADEKSSCWVRVSQMHTSGSVAIPRIGWEVAVEFEDGDPDKPIVVGRLYNGAFLPPSALPAAKKHSSLKSFSSPGGQGHNEFTMDDGAGGEIIRVHAQKDMNINVGNNKDEKVTTSQTIGVKVDQKMQVGANQTVDIGAKHDVNVGAAQKWSVGAARTKTVSGDEKLIVSGSRSQSIGAAEIITTPKTETTSTSGNYSETIGGLCLEAAAMGVSYATAGAAAHTVGGVRIEAAALTKSDITIGAKATTVGGAIVSAAGVDCTFGVKGAKSITVGGAWLGNAGGDATLSAKTDLSITVGGAVAMNASKIVLKVGGSSVSISGGSVVIDSSEIKLTASGPAAELAPMVGSK